MVDSLWDLAQICAQCRATAHRDQVHGTISIGLYPAYQQIQQEIIRILKIKGTQQFGAPPRGAGTRKIIELIQNDVIPPPPKGKGKGKQTDFENLDIMMRHETTSQKEEI